MRISVIVLINITLALLFGYDGYSATHECFKVTECQGHSEINSCTSIAGASESENDNEFLKIQNKWWDKVELKSLMTRVHSSYLIEKNNISECIVLIESRNWKYDCHACKATIGIAIFQKKNNRVKRTYDQNNIIKIGSWGKAPDAHLEKIGIGNIGIAFDYKYMAMGTKAKGYALVAKHQNQYKQVFFILTGLDESGYGVNEYAQWSSKLRFTKGNNENYFNIEITTQGTRPQGGKDGLEIMPYNKTMIYKFIDGTYKLM